MTNKESALERARRSGFATKLRLWFASNHRRWRSGETDFGPRSSEELSRVLSRSGEAISAAGARKWENGDSLPNARYVSLLTRLMGADWRYLDDPSTPWPRPQDEAALMALLRMVPASNYPALIGALEALARDGGGSA